MDLRDRNTIMFLKMSIRVRGSKPLIYKRTTIRIVQNQFLVRFHLGRFEQLFLGKVSLIFKVSFIRSFWAFWQESVSTKGQILVFHFIDV